jgi:uncharacterized protein (DUF2384 family)|nr:MAG TPA: Protein of unknown function (DUF2384) [Caudoviricetes sp.]
MTKEEILEFGLEVFNNEENKFNRWLNKLNLCLGRRPIDLLESEAELQELKNILTRIEYGNFI